MFRLVIDQQRCKGCGLCVEFCPQDDIELSSDMNEAGHHPACIISEEACTGCQMCVLMCPDVCIEIYRVKVEAEANA